MKYFLVRKYVCVVFVFLTVQVSGQQFTKFLSRQGFTQNSASALLQDSRGFIWIGTVNGLFKYDGYDFNVMRHQIGNSNSLVYNNVKFLEEDLFGNIWIGTSKGLAKYDPAKDKFSVINRWPFSYANFVKHTKKGEFIVGTSHGLFLSRYESAEDSLQFNEIQINNQEIDQSVQFLKILKSHKGEWLVGTNKGILRWIPGSSTDSFFDGGEIHYYNKYGKYPGEYVIQSIIENQIGGFYLGTTHGLFQLNNNSVKPVQFNEYPFLNTAPVKALLLDSKNDFWVGTVTHGLVKIGKGGNKNFRFNLNSPNSIGSNQVNALVEDHSGVLWIGTARGGLNKLNLYQKPFLHYYSDPFNPNSLSSNLIDCIWEDNAQNIWVGTFDGGLNRISNHGSETVFTHFEKEFGRQRIYSIVQDSIGWFYCSVKNKGLYKFRWLNGIKNLVKIDIIDEDGNEFGDFSIILIDSSGIVWLGQDGNKPGLIRYNPVADNPKERVMVYRESTDSDNPAKIQKIVNITEDSLGDLWLGTAGNGMFRVRLNNKTRKPVRIRNFNYRPFRENGLTSDRVFSILEGSNGYMWIGVFGGGIIRLLPASKGSKSEYKYLSKKDGLADDAVYGILEDDSGSFWISTNNGISKYSPEDSSFINFDIDDGLQENNFRKQSFHKGKSGKLYFGGINGITVFSPNEIKRNMRKPKVVFTGLEVFNKPVRVGEKINGRIILENTITETKKIVLRNIDNSFDIEFAALHYSTSEKNHYKYKLEGFDVGWNFTGSNRRIASYSNLKAGDYKFLVYAANSDEVWTENPAELMIKILPPWWLTIWAYLAYLLIIIGALYIFRRFILIRQNYITKLKLEKLEKENIKELNKAKLEFFTNITHEFKTPLTLIIGPVSEIKNSKETFPTKIKENLNYIQNNAERMLRLINQLIDFRRMETGHLELKKENIEITGFILDLVKSFKSLAQAKKIHLSLHCETDHLIIPADKDKLEKIFFNLVSNALKFTPDYGLVSLLLKISDTQKSESLPMPNVHWEVKNKLERFVEIQVSDTGGGLKSQNIKYIFERYYGTKESKSSQKITGSSSGIGLALVKGLVQIHGGELGVTSANDETTFIVRFPMQKIDSEPEILKNIDFVLESESIRDEPQDIVKTNELAENKLPLLLIVDDQKDIRDFVKSTFEKQYDVIEAVNGLEAYNSILKTIPDLIVSDVMMPVMDGFELCKKIKSSDITNHIPVILLTAKTLIENQIEGLEVGADAYIPKPFNVQYLKVRVEKLLELRQVLRSKYKNGFQVVDVESSGMSEHDIKFLQEVEEVIEKNLDNEDFVIDNLGKELAFSRMQLYRKLKALTAFSPNEFIRNYRLKRAAEMLRKGDLNVTEVLYQTGFSNKSYFTRCFKTMYGVTPKSYSQKYTTPLNK